MTPGPTSDEPANPSATPGRRAPEDKARLRYMGGRGREYHYTKRAIPAAAYAWVARNRLAKLAPYIEPDHAVLEYGVGFGWNLALLKCRRRIGYDIAAHLAEENRSHGIEFIQDIAAVPQTSLDVVICHHVLEHLLHPAETLTLIRSWLRPRGRLLLFVPYEKEARYRHYHPEEPNHHLYSWNLQTLGNLVTELDYRIVEAKLSGYGYDRVGAVWAVRLHLGELGFHVIRRGISIIWPLLELRVVAEPA